MGQIKIMSENLANKIAAGEVVERPLSVVKELVENSIDAGSSKIYITLKNSGVDYISVVDDGVGMDKEDALLCCSRHASSKLTSDEMLFKIATLGFRGEALSSIAAVSNVFLETCNGDESTLLEIEAGEILKCVPSSFRRGTTVTVTKLFYNTPARLKYIKNLYSESAKIIEYISKCALSNPNIVFKLMNDGKAIIETSGSGDYLRAIRDIYSMEIVKNLQEVNAETSEVKVKMFIAKPAFQRSNKNYMSVFVNKRVVNCPLIIKAILDEFKDYMPRNRYPFCIINIEIEPELIDVNIHPNKYEIKFSKNEEVIDLISKSIKEFLIDSNHKVNYSKTVEPKVLPQQFDLSREASNAVNKFEKEFEYKRVKEDEQISGLSNDMVIKEVNDTKEDSFGLVETSIEKKSILYEPIGQFNGTYILAQAEDELILIDQHAAVERINYEKNQDNFSKTNHTISDLLVPIVISKSLDESLIIKENLNKLSELNIDISEFGNSDFIVRGVPSWVDKGSEEQVIDLIIENILNSESIELLEIKDDVIELMSCRESLKANSRLDIQEMEYIIDKLFQCRNPYHCPHGRPIVVGLSLTEIEKLFKRIV